MTLFSTPNLALEGIHTTVPTSVTSPKIAFKLSNLNTFNHHTFNKYGHIFLCYKKLGSQESGFFHSGWFSDTLGRALSEQPILGGRLRQLENDNGFELMSNDSGVRIVEVEASVSLAEFLTLDSNAREEMISDLMCYKEVNEDDLHFSPFLYVQVTSFKCGGYTLGISYNLLSADPFLMESFVQKWSQLHKKILFATDIPKMPLLYLPSIKRMGNPPQLVTLKSSNDKSTHVVMLEVTVAKDPGFGLCNSIALMCIEEAESKTGMKMTPNFTLLVKEASGDIRVDVTSKPSLVASSADESKLPMKCLGWDELGTNGVTFWEGNVPTLVSHYVGSLGQDGLVYVVISAHDDGKIGMKVHVAFPN